MINTCDKCKSICCRTGPGPYVKLTPRKYINRFGDIDAYNTQCMYLVKNKCIVWNTSKQPFDCKVYVCQSRAYSKAELDRIKELLK